MQNLYYKNLADRFMEQDSRKIFKFSLKGKLGRKQQTGSSGFLSPQRKKRNVGTTSGRYSTISDVVDFLRKHCDDTITFDREECLYKIGSVYYTESQLLFKANRIRKKMGLKMFLIG